MDILKECPFDSTAPVLQELQERYAADGKFPAGSYTVGYTIRCNECGIEMHDEHEDALLKRWNKRVGDPVEPDEEDEG